jgi:hypothetical protein
MGHCEKGQLLLITATEHLWITIKKGVTSSIYQNISQKETEKSKEIIYQAPEQL